MKTRFLFSILLSVAFLFHGPADAQKPRTGCNDVGIKSQGEAAKTGLIAQGMKLFQEAMISMSSLEPAPVVVKLAGGQTYQFIFVGDQDANRMTMEIYDGKDKKLDEKVIRGGSNQIIYTFNAPRTDAYLVTLIQKKRGRDNMCGYFGVMMYDTKTANNTTPANAPIPTPVVKPAPTPVSTTTTTHPAPTPQKSPGQVAPVKKPAKTVVPDYEQKPNPNRTRATQQYLDKKKQGQP